MTKLFLVYLPMVSGNHMTPVTMNNGDWSQARELLPPLPRNNLSTSYLSACLSPCLPSLTFCCLCMGAVSYRPTLWSCVCNSLRFLSEGSRDSWFSSIPSTLRQSFSSRNHSLRSPHSIPRTTFCGV